jgi:DNA-directed RNA polymerase specialized sigma24 family protein
MGVPPSSRTEQAQLFAEHQATLRTRVARRVHTRSANIEEACGFAWLQLVRRRPRRDTALQWLTTVAVHEARRLDRADRHLAPLQAGGDPAGSAGTLTHAQAREALELVAGLPPRQREVFALHVAGYSYDEIARLSRVVDVVSGQVPDVSFADMSSTTLSAVCRFES